MTEAIELESASTDDEANPWRPRLDLRLVPGAATAWATAAWLVGGSSAQAVGVTVAAVLSVVAALAIGRRRLLPVALVGVVVALVGVSCAWRLADTEASPLVEAAARSRVVTLETTVARDAHTFEHRGITGSVVELTARRASWSGRTFRLRDQVTAFLDGEAADLLVGRTVVVRGRLQPSTETDVVAVVDVSRRGPTHASAWWWERSADVRASIRKATAHTGEEPAALVPALVDGDDAAISDEVREDFERSGLTHLLAVSGTNLTIVLAVVLGLARAAGLPRRLLVPLGLLAVVAFVLLARPDPSVVRAAGMGLVGLAATSWGGRGGVRALSVTVILLLTIDPWLARTAGFALSATATAGILLGTEPVARRLGRWLPRWAAIAVAVPVAAQLACTPIIAAISGEVSLVAVVANLLAGPLVAPTTILGLAAGLVGLVADPLGRLPGSLAGFGARGILLVGHRAASLSGASIVWPGPWWTLLLAVPVVAVVLWWVAPRPVVVAGLVVGLGVVMVRPPQPGWPPPGWRMVACDVGQGDATVLRIDDRSAAVVDLGPEPRALDRCLDALHVERVPLVVLTHAHADHVAGWPALTGRHLGTVLVGPTNGAPPGRPVRQVRPGQVVRVGAMTLELLGPVSDRAPVVDEGDGGGEGSAVNDASLVVRVSGDGLRVLLTGDAEPAAQDAILRTGRDLRADVLKMPHHGSSRQSERFFAAVHPSVATISAGRDNDYGHPAPAALDLLREQGIRWWRTDLDGDVAIVVRDGRLQVSTRPSGQESS